MRSSFPAPPSPARTRRQAGRNSGLTLIEILLVLALLALIAGSIAVNVSAMLPSLGRESLTEKFEESLRKARRAALDSGKAQRLEFDAHDQAFVIREVGSPEPEQDLAYRPPSKSPNTVRFLRQTVQANTYLVGGQLRSLEPATAVIFHPDGTCTPFTAEIREGNSVTEISIDPWTTAELAPPKTSR